MTELIGPPEAPAAGGGNLSGLQSAGSILAISGALTSAIGTYYRVRSQRHQARAAALQLDLEQSLATINARAAETDARRSLEAARNAIGRNDLAYQQLAATARARQAAGGGVLGVGSTGEVGASIEFSRRADRMVISRNSVVAASQARLRGLSLRNRATGAGLAAQNIRAQEGALSPGLASFTSLLGSAGRFAQAEARDERNRIRFARR